jgi:hypothetical protein
MLRVWRVAAAALALGGCSVAATPDLPMASLAAAPAVLEVQCDQDGAPAEPECLARLGGLAERKGDVLTLRLENGETKSLTTDESTCDEGEITLCLRYELVAFLPASHAFVVKVQHAEWADYAFISRRSGQITSLKGRPRPSSSGRYLLVIADPIEEWRRNEIEILSTRSDPPKLEWRRKGPESERYEYLSWEGDDRVRLHRIRDQRQDHAELARTERSWKLNSAATAGL